MSTEAGVARASDMLLETGLVAISGALPTGSRQLARAQAAARRLSGSAVFEAPFGPARVRHSEDFKRGPYGRWDSKHCCYGFQQKKDN